MSEARDEERGAHLLEVLTSLGLSGCAPESTLTKDQKIQASSEAIGILQHFYEDYCQDLEVDLTSTWVAFVLPGQSPMEPWTGLADEALASIKGIESLAERSPSPYNVPQAVHRLVQMKKKLGIFEQSISLVQDSPGLKVEEDLSTRFEEHKRKYRSAWVALSQDARDAVSGEVIAAKTRAETQISTLIGKLQVELPVASTSAATRTKRFEKLVIDNYDRWQSTSKSFRDSTFESFTSPHNAGGKLAEGPV